MSALYPSLEDLKVDQAIQVSCQAHDGAFRITHRVTKGGSC